MRYGSKYKAKKTTIDGIVFDSKHEAERYMHLRYMEKIGVIRGLQCQVKYVLIGAQREESGGLYKKGAKKGTPKPGALIERECAYIADFVYYENGKLVVEDAKGMKTKEYIIKRKMMLYFYGIRIRET